MEESPESFGCALKEAGLSDDDMLRLLWLAAKREAIEKEMGPVDPEQGQMEKGVTEASQDNQRVSSYHGERKGLGKTLREIPFGFPFFPLFLCSRYDATMSFI